MFDSRAFRSWPRVAVGALGFGALFGLVMLLAEALTTGGGLRLSTRVLALGGVAAAAYVGAAWLVRNEDVPRPH